MKPDVKKYLNVFQFLQDFYNFRKNETKNFSYDLWSKELGASDKSYVRFMVLGKRPINEKMILVFIANLKLKDHDRDYFETLVHYTQSKTSEAKLIFGKKLISHLQTGIDQIEISDHFEFLANPLLPRLQVFLSFNDIDKTPENLAWLLGTSSKEVCDGLLKLVEMKLVEFVENKYQVIKKSFKVPDNFGDLGLNAFYKNNLKNAEQAIDLPKEDRRYTSLFLPLNSEEFQDYLCHMQTFVNEQLIRYNADEYTSRRLFQIHMNIIPVSLKMPNLLTE